MPRYYWDDKAARYRNKRGEFVSNVRGALDGAIDNSAASMKQASEQLREGTISLDTWRATMQAEIKKVHVASVALGRGGHAQMRQADYGRAGGIIAREYKYLEQFARDIASGKQPLDGRMVARAEQYIKAGRKTYELTVRDVVLAHGFDLEKSVLGVADHCKQCRSEEELGWVPIGDLVIIGDRICFHNCQCNIKHRNSITGEIRHG